MRQFNYRIVNVFTHDRGPLTGNPLCVFEDARGLDDATMQALARQFNLSETTFILPSTQADARVRIFTPSYEMPFAGHPTLGTASVCRTLGIGGADLKLEMQAGVIPVTAENDRWTLLAVTPTWRSVDVPRTTMARMLGLEADAIGEHPLWVKAGKEQLIVPLRNEAAVRSIKLNAEAFAEVRSEDGHSMAYVFAEIAPGHALARFFFPAGNAILEDPATGSATANFGGWLIATGRALPASLQISQGEYVQRPSTLFLRVDTEKRIFVSGDVIELGRGVVEV
ncbi:MAG TPA: PhzF family phenazine biosynthesis protein [Steroidobacteraceae bacterium]|jgi:PhzF family phenazine biosynthesis protein|nr:PhzF family phenazine biosynthesis protein [Steroidobacteraceae bacterium]